MRVPFTLQAEYIFIEKNLSNYEHLNQYLSEQGLTPRFDKDIHLLHGEFTQKLDEIIARIKRSRRCIFLLDQYGYSEVPFGDIRAIFHKLPNAEIILTFATDWLIDYMANTPEYWKALQRTGIDQVLDVGRLLAEKSDNKDWRRLAQFELHRVIKSQSNAKHYTPFFIVSKEANRTFWLVHLSNHPRARDVMTELHWRLKNHFAHYGGPGIRMFGYDPAKDEHVTGVADLFSETEYSFDETAKNRTLQSMAVELPEVIHQSPDGIQFSELYRLIANTTPATSQHIKEAITRLSDAKELEILGPNGERRRKANRVSNADVLRLPQQKTFTF
ncbi:MAG: three-Cys-motif partner protein TcmP [Gammaproteobacteria bacterium]|nr:three-Cys-motif partner protein TcmP [Gammaproteobacteria bacterium]